MKIILPVAGIGTRLRPLTYTTPKVLISVAGKPILGWILDSINKFNPEEVIFIVGWLGDEIKRYVKENYSFKTSYIEQAKRLGLGHAVWLTRKRFKREPALIIYGDTIFEAALKKAITEYDGCLGVKRVRNPKRFGVVELENEIVKRLIEKPDYPKSNLAIVGINYIKNTNLLFNCLDEIIKSNVKTKGEFQLTDGFQKMIEKGAKLTTFPIKGWWDCGTPKTLLATNKWLLKKNHKSVHIEGSVVVPPVSIHPSAKIENCIVGPYVSIAENTILKSSIIVNSIINARAKIENLLLEGSIIGDNALCTGKFKNLNMGDSSAVVGL